MCSIAELNRKNVGFLPHFYPNWKSSEQNLQNKTVKNKTKYMIAIKNKKFSFQLGTS
jgi:hypothetical protein